MADIRKFFQPKGPAGKASGASGETQRTAVAGAGKRTIPPPATPAARSPGNAVAASASSKRTSAKKRCIVDSDEDEENEESKTPAKKLSRKRVQAVDDDAEDVEYEDVKQVSKRVSPRSARKAAGKEPVDPDTFFGNRSVSRADLSMVDKPKHGGKDETEILEKSAVATKKSSSAVGKLKKPVPRPADADDDMTFEELDGQPATAEVEQKLRASLKTQKKRPAKKDSAPKKRNRTESGSKSVCGADSEEDKPHKMPSSAKLQKAFTHEATSKLEPAEAGDEHSEKKRSSYTTFLNRSGPTAPGSKEIPEGAEDCLAGLAFCFTGEGESLSREEAIDLVKRYGARVVTAPSGKTDYVVVGRDAGPKKIEKIKQLKLKTLDEDGLLDLIRKSPAKTAESPSSQKLPKGKGKRASEPELPNESPLTPSDESSLASTSPQLWTDRYKPRSYKELIGNHTGVGSVATWLKDWTANRRAGFGKSPRAVLISGPPGIGKTTAAHLVCELEGFSVLEFNASDVRSKKGLEQNVLECIGHRTITEYYRNGKEKESGEGKQQVIIMDEVDGMSAGDRGGMGELISIIKKTQVPIICICNDRSSPKVRSLVNYCLDLKFRRPDAKQCRSRLMSIAFKENLQIKPNALDQLVQSTQSDIRQVLNLLSAYRLVDSSLDYDQSKALAKASEKNSVLNPFQMAEHTLNGSQYRKKSLSDKLNVYFDDFSIAPLMVQENYIHMRPARVDTSLSPKLQMIQHLELLANAAESISDGDLVDRLIHGDQHWSLMPIHSAFSCVRPASFVHGSFAKPGAFGPGFPSWLGQNSKTMKGYRVLRELQMHLRLRISGDRPEVRQAYIPVLIPKLTIPLWKSGHDGIPEVIDAMDYYYISREDWEAVVDLGIGHLSGERVLKDIPAAVKTAFTRTYNKAIHPVAVPTVLKTAAKRRVGASTTDLGGDLPDMEEAMDVDIVPDGDDEDGEDEDSNGNNPGEDALIRMKNKPAGKAAGASSSRKRKSAVSSQGRGGRK